MDKRDDDEGKEARLRSGGKGIRHCGRELDTGRTLHVERKQSGGAALPKESDTHRVALNGQILDGEGTLGQETCHLRLQGARSRRVGR